jgi:hypothetical protein
LREQFQLRACAMLQQAAYEPALFWHSVTVSFNFLHFCFKFKFAFFLLKSPIFEFIYLYYNI